jgi:ABC-type multidrug transport system fused ATPase/permease subunit
MAARDWLSPDWRRSVLALVFAGAGGILTGLSVWLAWNVLNAPWPQTLAAARLNIIGMALYATLGLLGLVLTGLAMTVALRQVSARFMGADFSASGGDHNGGAEVP